jgi:hypothetical protein
MPDTQVKVLLKHDDVTRATWLEVGVQSHNRPKLWGWLKVDANAERLEYLVSAAAEAIAMQQAASYSDGHDPASVAKAAREALKEIQATAEKARRTHISLPAAGK